MVANQVDILIKIREDLAGLRNTVQGMQGLRAQAAAAGPALGGISRFLPAWAGLAVAVGGAATAMAGLVREGIRFNATIEQQTVAFATLLGSADAAAKRLEDLNNFASSTPFELEEIIDASRLLQSLTGGALASGDALRLVGDAAAATGRSLQETAMWIGRLYAGLQSGTPVGEATLRLVEMGLVSGDTARQLNALAESGEGVGKAMDVVRTTFQKTNGAMAEQARTLNGLLSTTRDLIRAQSGTLTEPLVGGMKVVLEKTLESLGAIDTQQTVALQRRLNALRGQRQEEAAVAAAQVKDAEDKDAARRDAEKALAEWRATVWAQSLVRIAQSEVQAGEMMARRDVETRRIGLEEFEAIRRAQIQESFQLEVSEARLAAETQEKDERRRIELVEIASAEARQRRKVAEQELEADLARRREELARESLRRELDDQQRVIAIRRDELAAMRSVAQSSIHLTEVERRRETLRLLAVERDLLQKTLDILVARREVLTDPAAIEALNAQIETIDGQRRGVSGEIGRFEAEGDPESFRDQMALTIRDIRDQLGTTAQVVARGFQSMVGSAVNGLASGIRGLITLTMTWGDALRTIGTSILDGVIDSIARMAAEWITKHALMKGVSLAWHAFLEAMGWRQVASSNAQEAAKTPALATNAALSSIGSYGISAAVGIAALVAALAVGIAAATGSFREGGYTGDGPAGQVAGVVHRGEYVVPAPVVDRIGVPAIEAMVAGGPAPGSAGAGGGATNITFAGLFDTRSAVFGVLESADGERFLIDFMRRTHHRYDGRPG